MNDITIGNTVTIAPPFNDHLSGKYLIENIETTVNEETQKSYVLYKLTGVEGLFERQFLKVV